jgi:hypothetical protein
MKNNPASTSKKTNMRRELEGDLLPRPGERPSLPGPETGDVSHSASHSGGSETLRLPVYVR